uniref:hypothetical protein n=1 Tax=Parendozoicomonas sp. Alg238-R29 TaxID=2993446 RepID=UPI00248D970B
ILIFVDACGESVFNSANSLLIFLTKLYLNRLKTGETRRDHLKKDIFLIIKALGHRRVDCKIAEIGLEVCEFVQDNVSDIPLILQWHINWFLTLCHFNRHEIASLESMVKTEISQDQKGTLLEEWFSTISSTQLPDAEIPPNMAKWQIEWIQHYWEKPIKRSLPPFCPNEQNHVVSRAQRQIYNLLKNKYPRDCIGLECDIDGFSVDILLYDYNIAVEIDGSSHFVYPDPEWIHSQKAIHSSLTRRSYRTKYHFVDYMLSQYGLTVYRISSGEAANHSDESIQPICTQIDRVKCAQRMKAERESERGRDHRKIDEKSRGHSKIDEKSRGHSKIDEGSRGHSKRDEKSRGERSNSD